MTRKAFTAAINAYPAPIPIRQGSLNDLADLQNTLQIRGFSVFVSLTDGAATRASILSGLQALVGGAISGDSILFAFFGHGTPGGICPVDTNPYTGANVIYDHEIGAILDQKAEGVTIDNLLGCCYAGTGTRAMAESMPLMTEKKDIFKEKAPKVKKLIKAPSFDIPDRPKVSVPAPGMNHCLFAASSIDGLAWEVRMKDGSARGLHTLWFCYVVRNAPTWTRSQIDTYVSAKVKLTVPDQNCQVEGTSQELAQAPFT